MTGNTHKLNGSAGEKPMSSKRAYAGNARMIEIGSEGVPFRMAVNVDKIDCVRFEGAYNEIDVPVPGSGTEAVMSADGKEVLQPAIPDGTRKQRIQTGWSVIVGITGTANAFQFNDLDDALNCYNSVLAMISAVGVPNVYQPKLAAPPPPAENDEEGSPIVGVDGKAIKDAIDAVDLHPDLAGGDGVGIADNDDEDFTLSDDDLAMLENPEIDEDELENSFRETDKKTAPPLSN